MMHTGNTSGDSSSPDTSTPAPDSRYLQDLLNRVDAATAPPPSVAAPSALSRAVDRASSFFSSARSQRHTRLSDADEGEGVVPRDFGDYDDGGSSQVRRRTNRRTPQHPRFLTATLPTNRTELGD